jgi:uncharacterized protein (TIRG00374 family)
MKRLWRPGTLVWLALPVLIWWAWRDIPIVSIRHTFSEVSLSRLALLVAFNLFATLFFSSRWWLILRAQGYRLPYLSILAYRTAAFGINYFTPGSQFGGEPLQVHLLESRHGLPRHVALASVTLEKLFELLANFTFLACGMALILKSSVFARPATPGAIAWLAGPLLLVVIYLAALSKGASPLTRLLKLRPFRLTNRPSIHRLQGLAASTENQIASLFRHKPQAIPWVLGASGLIWSISLVEYWLALSLFGAQLTALQAVLALTAARLAFLTPLPGGLGALEAGQVLAMQALGYGPALGFSISLWIRLRDVMLGGLGLWLGAALSQRRPAEPMPAQAGD